MENMSVMMFYSLNAIEGNMMNNKQNRWKFAEAKDDKAIFIAGNLVDADFPVGNKIVAIVSEHEIVIEFGKKKIILQAPHPSMIARILKPDNILLAEDGLNGRCWVMETRHG